MGAVKLLLWLALAVVMGTYSMNNEMTDTETITMYTADKTGYKPRYTFKKHKLSSSSLKAAAGK